MCFWECTFFRKNFSLHALSQTLYFNGWIVMWTFSACYFKREGGIIITYEAFILCAMCSGEKYYGQKGFYAECGGGQTEAGGAMHIHLL